MRWFGKSESEKATEKVDALSTIFPLEDQDTYYWFDIYVLLNHSATCPYDGDKILVSALATHEATIKSLLERIERLEG
jgi:hypothetical protein